jgi:hypothetical protein
VKNRVKNLMLKVWDVAADRIEDSFWLMDYALNLYYKLYDRTACLIGKIKDILDTQEMWALMVLVILFLMMVAL